MLLSNHGVKASLDSRCIQLDPLDRDLVQLASINVRLDRLFRLFDSRRYPMVDPAANQSDLTHQVDVDPDRPSALHPGEFVLGTTYELMALGNDIATRLEGKSSLGHLGLLTHSTAGFIDPGFSDHVTLELSNTATVPILPYPGMKIGQLCFFGLSSPTEHPYGSSGLNSHYQGQRGPTPPYTHGHFTRTRIERQYPVLAPPPPTPSRLEHTRAGHAECAAREASYPPVPNSADLPGPPAPEPAGLWTPPPPGPPEPTPVTDVLQIQVAP